MKTSLASQDGAPVACPAPVLCCFLRPGVGCRCCGAGGRWVWFAAAAILLLAVFHRPLLRAVASPCIAHRPIENYQVVVLFGDTQSYYRPAQYDAVAKLLGQGVGDEVLHIPAAAADDAARRNKDTDRGPPEQSTDDRQNGNEGQSANDPPPPALPGAKVQVLVLDSLPPVPVQLGAMPSSGEFIRRQLIARGVSESAVKIADERFRDERAAAAWLAEHLASRPNTRALVVFDEFQTGRIARMFDAVFPPEVAVRVGLLPLPGAEADRGDWWRSRDGVKRLVNGWQGLLAAALADDRPPDDLWKADSLMKMLEGRIAAPLSAAESESSP